MVKLDEIEIKLKFWLEEIEPRKQWIFPLIFRGFGIQP
jgi:hypothetical protein